MSFKSHINVVLGVFCLTYPVMSVAEEPRRLTDKLTVVLNEADQQLSQTKAKTLIHFADDSLESFNRDVESLVKKANLVFGGVRSQAVRIVFNVEDEIYASYFSPTTQELNIGIKTREGRDEISSPIVIHELFHDVFLENFRLKYKNKNRPLLELQTMVLRDLGKLPDPRKTEQQVDEIMNAKYAFKLVGAYDELFADLASALFHNDGALLADIVKPYTRDSRLRNFTHIKKFRGWEPNEMTYTLFDPSRAAIWRLLQKNIHAEATPETIMKTFLLAAQEHVQRRMVKDALEIRAETPEKLNQEFFRLFLEKGREMKLWKSKLETTP